MIRAQLRSALMGLLGIAALAGGASQGAAQPALDPEVAAFVDEMVEKHQFRRTELRRLLAQAQVRPSIIRAMSTPGTARPWFEYRRRITVEGP